MKNILLSILILFLAAVLINTLGFYAHLAWLLFLNGWFNLTPK